MFVDELRNVFGEVEVLAVRFPDGEKKVKPEWMQLRRTTDIGGLDE